MKTIIKTGITLLGVIICFGATELWDTNMISPNQTLPKELGRVEQFAVLKDKTLAGDQVTFTVVDTANTNVWSLSSSSMGMTWHFLGPGVRMTFNSTNQMLERMVIDLVSPAGEHFLLIDSNGDGMPDARDFLTDARNNFLAEPRRQIVYRGAFLDCTGSGRTRIVRVEGRDVEFHFTGKAWEPVGEDRRTKDTHE